MVARKFQERISHWSFNLVVLISSIALTGWITNSLGLAGMGGNSLPMAPVTILSFLLTSIASIGLLKRKINPAICYSFLSVVIISCCIVIIDIKTGYAIGFEQLFGNSRGFVNNYPIGRMSPITSTLFLTAALSLIIITNKNKWHKLAIALSTVSLFVVFTFLLGYLYSTPLLYGQNIIPPAWNTSLSFALLFFGIITGFGMGEKPMNLFVGESLRARLMRGFMPFTLLIIIVAGWIDTIFIKIYNDHVLISALVTILSIFFLIFTIVKLSGKIGNEIDKVFAFRQEAEEKLQESELHFRTLANSGQALIWTSGVDKKCNYFNQPWLDFTGRSLEQELGDGWVEGVHPDDLEYCFKTYIDAFVRHERFSMDYRLRHHDGNYRWIQDNGTPRFNLQGDFAGYIGHCLDITEKKVAAEALRESEERYRLISSVATDYTFSTKVKPDGTLDMEWAAGAFEFISGYSIDEFKKRGAWRSTVHPSDLHIDDNDIIRLRNNQKTESEIRTINSSGEIVWVQVFAHPVWDQEKNCLVGIFGAVKNITDRKNAEEKLINSEQRFRELLEKVNLIAVILDLNGNISFSNEHLHKLSEYNHDELIGNNWFDLMIPESVPEVKEIFIDGLRNGEIAPRFENPIQTKSGKILDIVWSNAIQRNHEGQIIGVASIGEDVTERKLAESNLRETNDRLQFILENTPTAIWDWNIKTDLWYTTPNYYTMLGYQPENGLHDREKWLKRVHPEDRQYVEDKINHVLNFKDEKYSYTARLLHADGTYRWQTVIGHAIEHDESGKTVRMLGVRVDVDEAKKAEEEVKKLNIELEQKVTERTLELEKKNSDLKRMNKLFVGRELRMAELKNNIKALEEIAKNQQK